MFKLIAIFMAILGHWSLAVPLNDPSLELKSSPVQLQSVPSDIFPSLAVVVGSSSPDLAPSLLLEESPSNPEPYPAQESQFLEESSGLKSPLSDVSHFFESRIIGGTDAPPNRSRYIIALIVGWQFQSFICGASLITSRHVLTAAHCIVTDWHGNLLDTFHGRGGSNHWNSGGTIIEFEVVIIHPEYNIATVKNDCAVLKTKRLVEFSKTLNPVRLERKWIDKHHASYVTGWGTLVLWGPAPAKLQIIYIETISEKLCQKLLDKASNWNPPMNYTLEICTYHSFGVGMCHGDSGSPLMSMYSERQIGMVNWGVPCAVGGADIFTRVSAMMPFIDGSVHKLS